MISDETARMIQRDVEQWKTRRLEFKEKVKALCVEYKDINPKSVLEGLVIYVLEK